MGREVGKDVGIVRERERGRERAYSSFMPHYGEIQGERGDEGRG